MLMGFTGFPTSFAAEKIGYNRDVLVLSTPVEGISGELNDSTREGAGADISYLLAPPEGCCQSTLQKRVRQVIKLYHRHRSDETLFSIRGKVSK